MSPENIRKPEVQWHEMGEEVTKVLENLIKFLPNPIDSNQPSIYLPSIFNKTIFESDFP